MSTLKKIFENTIIDVLNMYREHGFWPESVIAESPLIKIIQLAKEWAAEGEPDSVRVTCPKENPEWRGFIQIQLDKLIREEQKS